MEANPSSAEGAALAEGGGIVVPEYDSSASELKDDTGGAAMEVESGKQPYMESRPWHRPRR